MKIYPVIYTLFFVMHVTSCGRAPVADATLAGTQCAEKPLTPEADEVFWVYTGLLSGQTFTSDDGLEESYSEIVETPRGLATWVETTYPSGKKVTFQEILAIMHGEVVVTRVDPRAVEKSFVTSVVGPERVLRTVAVGPARSGLLTRECVQRGSKTTCYVKQRIDGDVVVTVFERN